MKKIYYNGTIITMEEDKISQAVLIENGKIMKVGKTEELLKLADEKTEKIDLHQNTMLPGFIDGHSHLAATAYDLLMVNLKPEPSGNVNSIETMQSQLRNRLEEKTFKDGEWLIGTGYENTAFIGRKEITKYDLDEVSKEIPILIMHASGHVGVCNSIALEKLGYDSNHRIVEGGEVHCFPSTTELSGLLKEQAILAPEIQEKIGKPTLKELMDSIISAQKLYASFGYTTVQDGFTDNRMYPLLEQAATQNQLFLDVVSYFSFSYYEQLKNRDDKNYNQHYRIGGMKLFLDGSPQAKTAWLTQPYYVVPEGKSKDYCGFPIWSDEEVYQYCKQCLDSNLQLITHCNGDAAIDQLLHAYEKAKIDTNNNQALRPVLIHAQTIREDQLQKAKELGMIISFFLDHVYYYGDYHYESVLGKERASKISPAHTALKKGILFTVHQDTPVVLPNALFSIYNAVNRYTKNGRKLGEEECISVKEALKTITVNAAYQYFEEEKKGTITAGKVADFVIINQNPLVIDPELLKDIIVLETIKDGETVYKNKKEIV